MKTIVAGSRGIGVYRVVAAALGHALGLGLTISTVVSGTARGVDRLGEQWAAEHGVTVERYPADWETFGKSAGFRRNEQMLATSEAVVAIWDGESKGTAQLVMRARQLGKEVHVYVFSGGKLRRDRQLSQAAGTGEGAAQAAPDAHDDAWWRPDVPYYQEWATVDWDELRDDGQPHGARKRHEAAMAMATPDQRNAAAIQEYRRVHKQQRSTEGVGTPAQLCSRCARPVGEGFSRTNRKGELFCLPCADLLVQQYYERHPERKAKAPARGIVRRRRDGSVEEISDRYVARYHLERACWLVSDTKTRRWLERTFADADKAELHAAVKSMEWAAQQVGEGKQQDAWRKQGSLWSEDSW